MTAVHTQYFKAEILSVGMIVSLLAGSLVFGWSAYRTGSLVPAIVGHALLNVPMPNSSWAVGAQLVVMAAILAVAFPSIRDGWPTFRTTMSRLSEVWGSLAVVAAGVVGLVVLALANPTVALTAVPLLLVVSLALEARARRPG